MQLFGLCSAVRQSVKATTGAATKSSWRERGKRKQNIEISSHYYSCISSQVFELQSLHSDWRFAMVDVVQEELSKKKKSVSQITHVTWWDHDSQHNARYADSVLCMYLISFRTNSVCVFNGFNWDSFAAPLQTAVPLKIRSDALYSNNTLQLIRRFMWSHKVSTVMEPFIISDDETFP